MNGNIGKFTCYESKGSSVVDNPLTDYDIWNILTNFEVHDISDLSEHCAIKFSIIAQIREKEEIRLDPSDKR